MERDFKLMLGLSLPFMAAILLLDRPGAVSQLLLGLATAAFVWLLYRRLHVPAAQLLTCVVVATAGEIVLSLGWGLYGYRHAVIPLYVPPGHALFYALAAATSLQPALLRYEHRITGFVLAAGTVGALISLVFFSDTWGGVWWIAAAALLATSRNQLMLSACIAYTMVLEWAGTANGNWSWIADVPGLPLTSANPPAGVGLLYVLLDIIVVAICALFARRRTPHSVIPSVAEGPGWAGRPFLGRFRLKSRVPGDVAG